MVFYGWFQQEASHFFIFRYLISMEINIKADKTIPKDKPCRWQDEYNDCWFEMPDSKLPCKGKCKFYDYTGDYIGKSKH